MVNEFLKKEDLMLLLKMTDTQLKKFVSQGCPKFVKFKGYPVKEFCEWIVQKPQLRADRSKVREMAAKFLAKQNKQKKTVDLQADQTTTQEQKAATKKVKEVGIEAALKRIRNMEESAHKNIEDTFQKMGVMDANKIKVWKELLLALRECEAGFLKVLVERRELVKRKEVTDWLTGMIENTKTMLLNIPASLAPSLEGLPWPEIQKALEKELRNATESIRNFD